VAYLITGGAGYLGSHIVDQLINNCGDDVVVIDDFSSGSLTRLPKDVQVINCSISSPQLQTHTKYLKGITGMFHIAALKSVSESFQKPKLYEEVNFLGTSRLLDLCRDLDIPNFVFTSSAAVYGNSPVYELINESFESLPINPYGETKLKAEKYIQTYCDGNGISFCSLRIFNMSGAKNLNLNDNTATNVIPLLIRALNEQSVFTIFETSGHTPDGSPIRDYIHVNDVSSAHILAMKIMEQKQVLLPPFINISSGIGVSILEIINVLETITNKKVVFGYAPSRSGDPSFVIGDNALAKNSLNWFPSSDIWKIMRDSIF